MTAKPTDLVTAFYQAIARADAEALGAMVGESFHPDATIIWPDGLPYGGTITGAAKLAKVFAGMASSPVPMGPQGLEVASIVDGGSKVAAQLAFSWRAPMSELEVPSGALELWNFDDQGLVTEIKAYYWDTAACADLVRRAAEPAVQA